MPSPLQVPGKERMCFVAVSYYPAKIFLISFASWEVVKKLVF